MTGALVLVIVALVGLLGAHGLGYRMHVVQSGSMGDAAPTGSLALTATESPGSIAVGDIVVLQSPTGSDPVMHRVIERSEADGAVTVRTQGDANPSADARPAVLPGAVPVPERIIPLVGYAFLALRTTGGILATVTAIVFIIGLSTLLSVWRRPTEVPRTDVPQTEVPAALG